MTAGPLHRNRPGGALVLAAVAVGLALAPGSSAAPRAAKATPKPTPKTCSKLTVRTAVRGQVKFGHQGGKVLGCVLPDGPVVQVATESIGVVTQQVTFVQTTGPFAIFSVYTSENVDGGGSVTTRFVSDLRTGRRRSVEDPCDGASVLGADGRVAVLSTCSAEQTILLGVPPKGGRVYLDVAREPGAIPPGSVTLDGRTVRWTHGDVARTGRL